MAARRIILEVTLLNGVTDKDTILDGSRTGYFTSAGGEIAGCRLSANTPGTMRLSRGGGVSGRAFIDFYDANTILGSITTDGVSVSYEETSDYRLKSNVIELSNTSDLIKSLKPCSYEMYGTTKRGFLAHELQEICPEAVTGTKDATEAIGIHTDAEGVVTTDVTEPEAMPYGETWVQTGTRCLSRCRPNQAHPIAY